MHVHSTSRCGLLIAEQQRSSTCTVSVRVTQSLHTDIASSYDVWLFRMKHTPLLCYQLHTSTRTLCVCVTKSLHTDIANSYDVWLFHIKHYLLLINNAHLLDLCACACASVAAYRSSQFIRSMTVSYETLCSAINNTHLRCMCACVCLSRCIQIHLFHQTSFIFSDNKSLRMLRHCSIFLLFFDLCKKIPYHVEWLS